MRAFIISFLLVAVAMASAMPMRNKSENTIDRESSAFGFVAFPRVFDQVLVDHLETPLQFRAILYLQLASWNAWSNYHPTAADIFGRIRFKRPQNEHTRENKNVAALYAMLRVYEASPQSFGGPTGLPIYREMMREMSLDPEDMTMDMTTPIGIGNRVGKDTGRLLKMDGWNSEGDLTGMADIYKQPFQDYTGYTPLNTPSMLEYPFKWQPLQENNGRGFFFRQEFVTPYAGSALAFSLTPEEVMRREVKSPYANGDARLGNATKTDLDKLKRFAERVFRVSSKLTERKQLLAELFDNKAKGFRTEDNPFGVGGIATTIRFFIVGPELDLNLDEEMIFGLGSNLATFDSMVTAWKEKVRVDAVRPTGETMEMLFGDRKFEVFGGPGKENVMIEAGEWQPYIRTMPHSEFPSGSSCACSALVEHALIQTKGRDRFPYTVKIPKGSSKFFPGEVPAQDTEIKINRLSEWSRLCGKSRLWAGVHFRPSIAAGEEVCKGIGKGAYSFVDRLVNGELDAKWLQWLPEDVNKFWEED